MSLRSYAKLIGLAPNENGLISKKDIRTAFILLAKQYHPDKGAADSSEFVQRKEAYDKLLSACGDKEFVFVGSEFEFDALMGLVQSLAAKLKKHFDERPSPPSPTATPNTATPNTATPNCTASSTPPTVIKLRTTIKELYTGAWKKIKYKYLAADGTLQSDEIYICLESYQEEYEFPEKGDVVGDSRTSLEVKLDIESDPMMYVDSILTKYDICMDFTVSLYEYYYRDVFYIEYFGEVVSINYSPGLTLQTIQGKGLPYISSDGTPMRGDLVVFFKLVLPNSAPESLKPIFQEHFGFSSSSKSEGELQST